MDIMNQRIENFANKIKGYNEKSSRLSKALFIACLMAVPEAMLLFSDDYQLDIDFIIFRGIGPHLCLIVLVFVFSNSFYNKYIYNGEMLKEVDLENFIGMHAISINDFFKFISKKLLPYQLVLGIELIFFSFISEHKVFAFTATVLSLLISFLTGFLKKKYFCYVLTRRGHKSPLTIVATIGHFIVMILMITVSVCCSFLFTLIAENCFEPAVLEGCVYERVVGKPILMIMLVAGIEIAYIAYAFSKKNEFTRAIITTSLVIGLLGLVGTLASARLWYYEINFSQEQIKVVHFTEKDYSFSDVTDYQWKSDEDDDSAKTLVLYLNDGTVLDLNDDGEFTSEADGIYSSDEEKKFWPCE